MIESLDTPTLLKGFVGLFGSGGLGAVLINLLRRGKGKGDVAEARSADLTAEADKERSDAQLATALNSVAERWVERAERKLQEAEDTIAKLTKDLHGVRNELMRYRGQELENERLKLRVDALIAENASLRARLGEP